jgi:hypothetical protein
LSMSSAFPAVRIYDDCGGHIGEYLAKYHALRVSGEQVVIDGICASACTMLLGTIPRDRICVTQRAVLEFHAAGIRHLPVRRSVARATEYCGRTILPTCASGSAATGDVGLEVTDYGGGEFPLPQHVAIDDCARIARHIVEDAALDKRVYARVAEQDQRRTIIITARIARDLPSLREQLVDRQRCLRCRQAGRRRSHDGSEHQ